MATVPCSTGTHSHSRRTRARLIGRIMVMALIGIGVAAVTGACADKPIVVACPLMLSVTVLPASYTIPVGDTAAYTVTVSEVVCSTPSSHKVTWSVSNPAVGRIVRSTDSTVVLVATGAGQASVGATSVEDANVKSAGLLTVIHPPGAVRVRAP